MGDASPSTQYRWTRHDRSRRLGRGGNANLLSPSPAPLPAAWRFRGARRPPAAKVAAMTRLSQWQWPQRFPLVQFPNAPLIVALLAGGGARLSSASGPHRVLLSLHYLALGLWAYEEARAGANWFRRALGAGFALYVLVELSRS